MTWELKMNADHEKARACEHNERITLFEVRHVWLMNLMKAVVIPESKRRTGWMTNREAELRRWRYQAGAW
jgi:hypothetical protein